MAHAYRSLEDGQVIVSEAPRPDLEEVARWEKISEAEADVAIAAQPAPLDEDTESLLAYLAENEITAEQVLELLLHINVGDTNTDTAADATPPPAIEAPAGNASTEKWAEYARELGVEIPADANREAIKAAIDEAKTAETDQ